ncbi:MAG: M48 family metallopeptidase [Terracidiphilus sp.]
MSRVRRALMLLAVLLPLAAAVTPCVAQPATSEPGAHPETSQPAQAYNLPPEKLAKAITLSHIRTALDIGGSLWGMAVLWFLVATGAAAALSAWTTRLLHRRWMQGLLFFAAFFVITALASLPLDATGHFVSLHFQISVQGWASWLGDEAKSLAISVVLGSPVLLFFNWVVRVSPRRYWIWLWAVSLPLILLVTFAEPLVIDPLFNKFEPLSDHHAALVGKLETVVARTGNYIPPERMFLMKASEKSNGLNAYVTGIGASKRYVMWDTATDRLPDDEVLFIFGHESGHYVLHHIPKMLGGTILGLFFVFWACARFSEWLVRRNGLRWQAQTLASHPGFLVLLFALSVAGFVLQPASNTFSRYFEHEADVYGQEAIHSIVADPQRTAVSAYNHLGEAWLEDPNPSAFIEFWEFNHPSVQSRANFAAHYGPWANGGHGRFFDK